MSSSSSASEAVKRLAGGPSSVAALLVGDVGGAQCQIAQELAAAWHCLAPINGEACGECRACGALSRGASVDLLLVEPGGPQDLIRLRQIVDDPAVPEPNIKAFLQSPPAIGRNRIVWIEQADRLSNDAANALLKTIEEPGVTARFVLTTTASGRIIPTIRSRCVLIPCDSPELPKGFAGELAGGSPVVHETLSTPEFAAFLADMEKFVESLEQSTRAQAVALADTFLSLADQYANLVEGEDRLRRSEFIRLFANVAGSRAAGAVKWTGMLDRAIVMHRTLLGNVNATYLADWLFTG